MKEALFLENDFCVEEEVNLPKNDLERNRENDDKDDDEEEETEEEEEEHVVVGFIIIIFALFTRRQTQSVIRVRVFVRKFLTRARIFKNLPNARKTPDTFPSSSRRVKSAR